MTLETSTLVITEPFPKFPLQLKSYLSSKPIYLTEELNPQQELRLARGLFVIYCGLTAIV